MAWTENISNVDFYYSLGMITLEITFKNNEKIEVTLDELYNQNKIKDEDGGKIPGNTSNIVPS